VYLPEALEIIHYIFYNNPLSIKQLFPFSRRIIEDSARECLWLKIQYPTPAACSSPAWNASRSIPTGPPRHGLRGNIVKVLEEADPGNQCRPTGLTF